VEAPRDRYKECQALARTISLQCEDVKFNKSLSRFLANKYLACLDDLEKCLSSNGVLLIDPDETVVAYSFLWPDAGETVERQGLVDVNDHLI
jgi:hypothetical protein